MALRAQAAREAWALFRPDAAAADALTTLPVWRTLAPLPPLPAAADAAPVPPVGCVEGFPLDEASAGVLIGETEPGE